MKLNLNPPWHPRHITDGSSRPALDKIPPLRILHNLELGLAGRLGQSELIAGELKFEFGIILQLAGAVGPVVEAILDCGGGDAEVVCFVLEFGMSFDLSKCDGSYEFILLWSSCDSLLI